MHARGRRYKHRTKLRCPQSIFGTPAFWQNKLYFAGSPDKLSIFAFDPTTGQFNTTPTSQSTTTYGGRGTMPSISSDGNIERHRLGD